MSAITKAARGQECQVRMPGICNRNPETVVLAHYRLKGSCGTGIKPPDYMGAFACSACHDEADRRTRRIGQEEARQYHAEGVMRTQQILAAMGLMDTKG